MIIGIAGVVYVISQANKVMKKQDEVDEQSTRIPQYFSTGDNNSEFIKATKVYKDGPISWVAEASDGSKWVQYSSATMAPPALMRKYALLQI